MKEYIEREAVEEMLENAQIISNGEYCGYCTEDVRLNSIPTAKVAEVRHGRWVNTNKEIEQMCKCSECGYPVSYFWSRTPYCPNCGARMDGGDK